MLTRALRKSGKKSEASFVQKLPKPAFSAWLVNHVYWHESDLFQRLLEAGDHLRQAQKDVLPGQGLSSLKHAQRKVPKAIDSLLGAAQQETARMERPFTAQTERRFIRALEAIAQAPRESFDPPLGRFVEDLMPTGFDGPSGTGGFASKARQTGCKESRPILDWRERGQAETPLQIIPEPLSRADAPDIRQSPPEKKNPAGS